MKANILKNKATTLRKNGFSFREIGKKLRISKSTASSWLRNIKLSKIAKKRIYKLGVEGRIRGNKTIKKKREVASDIIKKKVDKYFLDNARIKIDPKIACALLYWGEGTKCDGNKAVSFTNADPGMIKYFLRVFRDAFKLEERKFRALIHLHEYHDVKKQLEFWSKVTGIPLEQFNKSYLKKNTGKNKKENYPGCINVKYCDISVYRELMFIIEGLMEK